MTTFFCNFLWHMNKEMNDFFLKSLFNFFFFKSFDKIKNKSYIEKKFFSFIQNAKFFSLVPKYHAINN